MSTSTESTETAVPMNREAWLHALAEKLAPLMKDRANLTLHEGSYKLSVGFPSVRARAAKGGRIGECWHGDQRKTKEIFVHPKLGSAVQVAETVLHELIHAALPAGAGHKKPFSQAAKRLGLMPEGAKPTATFADEEMRKVLEGIVAEIGPYPHEALDTSRMPKQSTRLLKVMCQICGRTVRDTRKWLDESGAPICATCDIQMEEVDSGDKPSSPLISVNCTHEFKVPPVKQDPKAKVTFDPRWSIRMTRNGHDVSWYVIDYGEPFALIDEPIIVNGQQVGTRKVKVVRLDAIGPRLTAAQDREDALNLLEALRDNLMSYEDVEELLRSRDETEYEDEEDEEYLDEEEDETPDYPEDQVDDEDEYEASQRQREAAVEPAGNESSPKVIPIREEREIGSMQRRWTL